jgi:hypothetical protein
MDPVSSAQMTFDSPSRGSLLRPLLNRPFSAPWKESLGGPSGWHISDLFRGISRAILKGLESHTGR